MKKIRIEKDFLGEMQVPADKYYGGQTARALLNFPVTGQKLDEDLIHALGMIKYASAKANAELGLLPADIGAAIMEASAAVFHGDLDDEFPIDPIQGGAGTSTNMNANEVIANKALEILGKEKGDYSIVSPNTHVNMAQSTNDVYPTALHVAALIKAGRLQQVGDALARAFRAKEREFDEIVKMARTQLQDAVPIRLGQEFGAWAQVVERRNRRVTNAVKNLIYVNMGGTAVGTALNADPSYIDNVIIYLSETSGYQLVRAENLIDATQNADIFAEVSDALKTFALTLSKIANDLRLLSSGPRCGFQEINLPEMQPGSSIMPYKVNPVIPELVNQVAFQVVGHNITIGMAVEAGQLELNVMEPVIGFNLFRSFDYMTRAIEVFRARCIEGITADEEVCRSTVERSIGIVTALNPYIGYENSCSIAQEAYKTGKSVREVCLSRGILTEEQLNRLMDPKQMTEPRIVGKEVLYSGK
jgi:aspartate ammonia-lyase